MRYYLKNGVFIYFPGVNEEFDYEKLYMIFRELIAKNVYIKILVILIKTLQKIRITRKIRESKMTWLKSKIGLIQAVFLFLVVQDVIGQDDALSVLKRYIENKFNVKLDSSYVITTHTREDVFNYWISNQQTREYANENLNNCNWKTNAGFFIDSVYSKDSAGNFNGLFIDFFGDSLSGYRLTFYKHGKKDSIELIYGCDGLNEINRYKNGVKHGIWEQFNNDGKRVVLEKYEYGEAVDTSFVWYDNGNVLKKIYHENGEIIWEKCFEEDGKTEMECDF